MAALLGDDLAAEVEGLALGRRGEYVQNQKIKSSRNENRIRKIVTK
jgi:hypothetical protein